MRKSLLSFLGFLLFVFPSFVHAAVPEATAPTEHIASFNAKIEVRTDRSIRVQETIRYDFGNEQRRGIYRDIPYVYDKGEMDIRIESVTDEHGKAWTTDVSRQGGFVRIKVGDANTYLTGEHTYVITYTAKEAIQSFSDHEELYWNVTGDGWGVPIDSASAEVILPTPATKTACYVGERGSKDEARCSVDTHGDVVRYVVKKDDKMTIPALQPSEGLTIVAAVSKGSIIAMTSRERWLGLVKKYWPLGLPVVALIIMTYVWRKTGRDPETGKYAAPMYEAPDKLSPAEVGVVWDEQADRHDISATIIDLAVRGYLTIREVEDTKLLVFKSKDYVFTKTKEADKGMRIFESTLLEGIFDDGDETKLSDLNRKFSKTYERIQSQLFWGLTKRGYFHRNPRTVRNAYIGGGVGLVVTGVILGILANSTILGVGIGLCGLVLLIFASGMPQRTLKGAETKVAIAGLKLYLTRAEKKQLEFLNAPAKKPETFEKLLPYAMALGVEEAWAKEFEGIYKQPPTWYQSSHPGSFQLGYMMGSLNSFSHAAEAALPAPPSGGAGSGSSGFGGGGFSGGGFGGGGGGSW